VVASFQILSTLLFMPPFTAVWPRDRQRHMITHKNIKDIGMDQYEAGREKRER
jgi:hypothetical protein